MSVSDCNMCVGLCVCPLRMCERVFIAANALLPETYFCDYGPHTCAVLS
jgi:hypothetical protein